MSYPQAVADKYTGGVISKYHTPLHDAAGEGDIDKIKFCLEHGMDVNSKNLDGWTSLAAAAHYGKLDAVKYLIERGADPTIKTLGKMPVWYAEQQGHSEIVAYLKSLGGAAPSKAKTAAKASCGAGTAGAASCAATATSAKKSKKTPVLNLSGKSPYEAYVAKVDALLSRLTAEDDAIPKVVKEFHKLGETFFKGSSTGYVSPGDAPESFEKLTKSQFAEKYEELTDDKPSDTEASFSDAFRHAGLIDIETLKMYPFEHKDIPNKDHVLSWPAVTNLPDKLAGTNLVALHGDTEDGLAFFFPLPTKPRAAPGTAKATKSAKARKSRRARR